MSSRIGGFWINVFFLGIVIVGLGVAVDKLVSAYNNMTIMGLTSQMGSDTLAMLNIIFYAIGFIFMIVSGINIVINARNTIQNEEV